MRTDIKTYKTSKGSLAFILITPDCITFEVVLYLPLLFERIAGPLGTLLDHGERRQLELSTVDELFRTVGIYHVGPFLFGSLELVSATGGGGAAVGGLSVSGQVRGVSSQ